MKKDKHPIDQYFEEGLKEHTTEPPASVWEKIEVETEQGRGGGYGPYILRAAIVVLMIGIGGWLYFQQQDQSLIVSHPVEETVDELETKQRGREEVVPSEEDQKEEPATRHKKGREKVEPDRQGSNTTQPVYVSNEPLPEVVDEEELYEDQLLATISLDPARVEELSKPTVKVKLRLSRPVTASTFYAESDSSRQEDQGIKERLYAYASDQWGNIVSGKPVELPKTNKRPQLEINLNRIF